jgi:hypothetical protein
MTHGYENTIGGEEAMRLIGCGSRSKTGGKQERKKIMESRRGEHDLSNNIILHNIALSGSDDALRRLSYLMRCVSWWVAVEVNDQTALPSTYIQEYMELGILVIALE